MSSVLPLPPFQSIVKDHWPAPTVCTPPGFASEKTEVLPPVAVSHAGGARVPGVVSIVEGVHAGAVPVPWRYSGLPAAWLMGTREELHSSAPRASTIAATTIQPSLRGGRAKGAATACTGSAAPVRRMAGPSQRLSHFSLRRWRT